MNIDLLFGTTFVQIIQMICWAFFHSFWIGVVFCLIIFFCNKFLFQKRTYTRYKLYLLFLCGFVCLFLIKLVVEFQKIDNVSTTVYVDTSSSIVVREENYQALQPGMNGFIYYFNQVAVFIFIIWLIGFIIKSKSFFHQLAIVRKLKKSHYYPASADLKDWFKQEATRLDLKKSISLLHSTLISSPIQIGHLKPSIVLPSSWSNLMQEDELKPILLHELVHIKNKDYFINFCQTLGGMIFFFNPAFTWLSRVIDTQREFCCDDEVVNRTGDKKSYAETLIHSFEYSLANPTIMMRLAGGDSNLMVRVRRLAGVKYDTVGRWFLFALIILGTILYALNPHFKSMPGVVVKEEQANIRSDLFYHSEGCKDIAHKGCKRVNETLKKLDSLPLGSNHKQLAKDLAKADLLNQLDRFEVSLNKDQVVVNGLVHTGWIVQLFANKYLSEERSAISFSHN